MGIILSPVSIISSSLFKMAVRSAGVVAHTYNEVSSAYGVNSAFSLVRSLNHW